MGNIRDIHELVSQNRFRRVILFHNVMDERDIKFFRDIMTVPNKLVILVRDNVKYLLDSDVRAMREVLKLTNSVFVHVEVPSVDLENVCMEILTMIHELCPRNFARFELVGFRYTKSETMMTVVNSGRPVSRFATIMLYKSSCKIRLEEKKKRLAAHCIVPPPPPDATSMQPAASIMQPAASPSIASPSWMGSGAPQPPPVSWYDRLRALQTFCRAVPRCAEIREMFMSFMDDVANNIITLPSQHPYADSLPERDAFKPVSPIVWLGFAAPYKNPSSSWVLNYMTEQGADLVAREFRHATNPVFMMTTYCHKDSFTSQENKYRVRFVVVWLHREAVQKYTPEFSYVFQEQPYGSAHAYARMHIRVYASIWMHPYYFLYVYASVHVHARIQIERS